MLLEATCRVARGIWGVSPRFTHVLSGHPVFDASFVLFGNSAMARIALSSDCWDQLALASSRSGTLYDMGLRYFWRGGRHVCRPTRVAGSFVESGSA